MCRQPGGATLWCSGSDDAAARRAARRQRSVGRIQHREQFDARGMRSHVEQLHGTQFVACGDEGAQIFGEGAGIGREDGDAPGRQRNDPFDDDGREAMAWGVDDQRRVNAHHPNGERGQRQFHPLAYKFHGAAVETSGFTGAPNGADDFFYAQHEARPSGDLQGEAADAAVQLDHSVVWTQLQHVYDAGVHRGGGARIGLKEIPGSDPIGDVVERFGDPIASGDRHHTDDAFFVANEDGVPGSVVDVQPDADDLFRRGGDQIREVAEDWGATPGDQGDEHLSGGARGAQHDTTQGAAAGRGVPRANVEVDDVVSDRPKRLTQDRCGDHTLRNGDHLARGSAPDADLEPAVGGKPKPNSDDGAKIFVAIGAGKPRTDRTGEARGHEIRMHDGRMCLDLPVGREVHQRTGTAGRVARTGRLHAVRVGAAAAHELAGRWVFSCVDQADDLVFAGNSAKDMELPTFGVDGYGVAPRRPTLGHRPDKVVHRTQLTEQLAAHDYGDSAHSVVPFQHLSPPPSPPVLPSIPPGAPMLSDPMSSGDPLSFETAARKSHSEQPMPPGGVPRAIREASEMHGIDPVAELFNEALAYASEGHLRLARERLQMLLCMAPDDSQGRILLARVHGAGGQWRDAASSLEAAAAAGANIPPAMRRAVDEHARGADAGADEERTAVRAREQGELKALRQEARRLRTENATLNGRGLELEREARRWAWATAGVAGFSVVFLSLNLALGFMKDPQNVATVTAVPEAVSAAVAVAPSEGAALDVVPPAPVIPPVTPADAAKSAAEALAAAPSLAGSELEVEIDGGSARLIGSVLTVSQRAAAKGVVLKVHGITTVETKDVTLKARTSGASHIVAKNENLGVIAQRYYGDAGLVKPILAANKAELPSPEKLRVGQQLRIPPVE